MQGKIQEQGKVPFLQAFTDFFRGYFDFGGRSTRAGYWWLTPLISIIQAVLLIMPTLSFLRYMYTPLPTYLWDTQTYTALNVLGISVALFLEIPKLALLFRRFRDAGLTTTSNTLIFIFYMTVTIVENTHGDAVFCHFIITLCSLTSLVLCCLPTDCLCVQQVAKPWVRRLFRTPTQQKTKGAWNYKSVASMTPKQLSEVDQASLAIQKKHLNND